LKLLVLNVEIPGHAQHAYGYGRDDSGNLIKFIGDHRPMAAIAEAIHGGERIGVDISLSQIVAWSVRDPDDA
jgi:hypothetical protein